MSERKATMKELIQDIEYRLTHLEDMEMDCRNALIKIVEQNNKIVEFLTSLEIHEMEMMEDPSVEILPELPKTKS